jgi:hypothetical protein
VGFVDTMSRLALPELRLRCWCGFVGCPGREEGEGERCLGRRFASCGGREGAPRGEHTRYQLGGVSNCYEGASEPAA